MHKREREGLQHHSPKYHVGLVDNAISIVRFQYREQLLIRNINYLPVEFLHSFVVMDSLSQRKVY